IEGFAREMAEETMAQAIVYAHKHIITVVDMVEELRVKAGLGKKELPPPIAVNPLIDIFRDRFGKEYRERKQTSGKQDRADSIKDLKNRIVAEFLPEAKVPEYTPRHGGGA